MSLICPSVLAADPEDYLQKIETLEPFAKRIHIDLSDGLLAPAASINLIQAWWPPAAQADIHLMYLRPLEHIETLVSLKPDLVIVHAEAEGDIVGMVRHLKLCGLKAGVCLLPAIQPEDQAELIGEADHVLIFSGKLGSYGGNADLGLLEKVKVIKQLNRQVEIGWDGGANRQNAAQIAAAGVDVIVAGSSIMEAGDPAAAYVKLANSISSIS